MIIAFYNFIPRLGCVDFGVLSEYISTAKAHNLAEAEKVTKERLRAFGYKEYKLFNAGAFRK